MANIFTAASPGTSLVSNKCLLGIYNGIGSGKVIRVYKAVAINAQTVAIATPTIVRLAIQTFSSGSGGINIQPLKHDSSSSTPPSQIICSTNMSYKVRDTFRKVMWAPDEPLVSGTDAVVSSGHIDELLCLPSIGVLWDSTYNTSSPTEPIVLREGLGMGIVSTDPVIQTQVGYVDVFLEFTIESS